MATGRDGAGKAGIAVLVLCSVTAQILFIAINIAPDWPLLAALSNFTPVFPLLALCALAAVWMIGKQRIWRGALVMDVMVCLIMLGVSIWPSCPLWPAPATDAGSVRALKIISFNAWTQNRDPVRAAQWILAQRPDAVILLEASGRSAIIAALLAPSLPYKVSCRGDRSCSTLILSRWKPSERAGFARGDADNRRALSAAYMRFATPAPGFSVVAVHLSRPWPIGAQQRELALLAAKMRGRSREGLLIAGDFNATDRSITLRRAEQQLGVRAMGGDPPSWPAPFAGFPLPALLDIDHALLGSGWSAARTEHGPELGSDHYPLVITLQRGNIHAR